MPRITPESLLSLEEYSKARSEFRARVMAHKKSRIVHVGEHVTLIFEDELTIRYQVQEMLRAERIFEEEGIAEELAAYNPLVPDGSNWKATMLIEYPDAEERRVMLSRLIGIDDAVWVQVHGCARVPAIADEDLERETDEKTSSVHFLRFELAPPMITALRQGAGVAAGIDHPNYSVTVDALDPQVTASLLRDLAVG
jgi:Protein of unknown function (DUF3501)